LNVCLEAFALTDFSELLVWQLCYVVNSISEPWWWRWSQSL